MVAASIVPNSEVLIKCRIKSFKNGHIKYYGKNGGNYEIVDKAIVAGEPIGSINVKTAKNLKPFIIQGDILLN